MRTNPRLHRRPWNHDLHLIQKQLATRLPTILLKHTLTRQDPLLHRNHITAIRLINQAVNAELGQRFLERSSVLVDTSHPMPLKIFQRQHITAYVSYLNPTALDMTSGDSRRKTVVSLSREYLVSGSRVQLHQSNKFSGAWRDERTQEPRSNAPPTPKPLVII